MFINFNKYVIIIVFLITAFAKAQNDSIQLKNNDILVGEVKSFSTGILVLKTSYSDEDFNIKKLNKKDYSKTMRYLRAYLDLCSEEYDLWLSGNIEERIWVNWEEGIRSKFSNKAFSRAWKVSNYDSHYYSDFCKWMEGIVK